MLTQEAGDAGRLRAPRSTTSPTSATTCGPKGSALVVGVGGGRDVLSALHFGATKVTGVEINTNILETLNGRFGDFTGHLDRDPRVRFVNDEARSFIARNDERFDVIQISLIDTWAATAAGAFVLSENSLYTVEAWDIFLSHLSPRGLLSVSRWSFSDRPGEVYRMIALATAALQRRGVADPRAHMAIVRSIRGDRRRRCRPTASARCSSARRRSTPAIWRR